ncbi:MAG TPA: GAF domain-containing protein [Thermomicrobiales bacterium]|nr:GAF domain-containing protein [Thermomicrobiales bacterium]
MLLLGAILFFLGAALSGIIGNRTDALLVRSFPWLTEQFGREIPVWGTLTWSLALLGLALVVLYLWQRSRAGDSSELDFMRAELEAERAASSRADHLVQMGDSLLRLLARLNKGTQIDAEFVRLLEEYLRDATGVFEGDVTRGMILLREGQELVPLAGFQMPQATMQRSRFRIAGRGREARGIAGIAYLTGEPKVVHFEQREGRFESDMPNDYIVFDDARPFPPYRSFIAAPIPGGASPHGVICFDSMRVDAFDSIEIQSLVANMALQVSSALAIYHRISD